MKHIAFTIEDQTATFHNTKAEAKKAANERMGRVAGVRWEKAQLNATTTIEEKADDGELWALLFNEAQAEAVARSHGIKLELLMGWTR